MCDPTIPLWRSVIERVARSFGGWQEKKKTSWKTQLGQFSGSLSHKECPPCSEDVFMDRRAELGQNILQKLLHNNQTCDVAICGFIFWTIFQRRNEAAVRIWCSFSPSPHHKGKHHHFPVAPLLFPSPILSPPKNNPSHSPVESRQSFSPPAPHWLGWRGNCCGWGWNLWLPGKMCRCWED